MTTLTGLNSGSQSLNGITTISDGSGTNIQDGSIETINLTLAGNLINNFNTISNQTLSFLYGATSNIQTQINSINVSSILTLNNIFTGSNYFSSTSGNIIDRLFCTILSINTNNTRRSVANFFECALGQTSSYIYFSNAGTFGLINTNNNNLNWNISLNGVITAPTINTSTGNIETINCSTNSTFQNLPNYINTSDKLINQAYVDGRFTSLLSNNSTFTGSNTFNSTSTIISNLYSNILAINNNNVRRATNDIFEVATSPTSNYLYYNNSSVFGFINTNNSSNSWFIDSSGSANIPTINCSTNSTFQNLPNYINTSDKLINKTYVDTRFTNIQSQISSINTSSLLSLNNTWTNINTFTNSLIYKYISSGSIFKIISYDPILNISLGNTICHGSIEFWSNVRLNASAAIKSFSTSNSTSNNNLSGYDDAGDLEFYTSNGNSGAQRRMIISENGNVSIGNSYANNNYLFSVNGSSNLSNTDFSGNINLLNGSGSIISNNSLNVYSNVITSITSNKTLGLTNITVATITLQPYYSQTFTFNSPISLYRQYKNSTANGSLFNRLYDTLNSVTYTILKNGSNFASGTCTTNNNLPNTQIYVTSTSSTSSRNYEIYITNAICSFTPTFSSTSDTYIIKYTVNYSQDTAWQNFNLIMESFGYYINTNISSIVGDPTIETGGFGSNYSSFNYSLSTTNYSTNSSQLQINSIISNSIQNQNTISTNNLISNNLTSNNFLFSPQITPAYMLDGTKTTGFVWWPITCSQYKLKSSDLDDIYIVYPGYKLIVYYNDGYNSQAGIINNYTGTIPTYILSGNLYGGANQINSCRLYYLNDSNEITNVLIS